MTSMLLIMFTFVFLDMWEILAFAKVKNTYKAFNESVLVWLQRPNVCSKIISCCNIQSDLNKLNDDIPKETKDCVYKLIEKINSKKCPNCGIQWKLCENTILDLCIRKLVPRRHDLYSESFELFVPLKNCYFFLPLNTLHLPFVEAVAYIITFCEFCIQSSVSSSSIESSKDSFYLNFGTLAIYTWNFLGTSIDKNEKKAIATKKLSTCFVTKTWLQNSLFPNLSKWSQEQCQNSKSNLHLPPSLSLIEKEKYSVLYQKLKTRYGVPISQVHT